MLFVLLHKILSLCKSVTVPWFKSEDCIKEKNKFYNCMIVWLSHFRTITQFWLHLIFFLLIVGFQIKGEEGHIGRRLLLNPVLTILLTNQFISSFRVFTFSWSVSISIKYHAVLGCLCIEHRGKSCFCCFLFRKNPQHKLEYKHTVPPGKLNYSI